MLSALQWHLNKTDKYFFLSLVVKINIVYSKVIVGKYNYLNK